MFISLFSLLLYWITLSEKFQTLLKQFIVLFFFFIIINGKFQTLQIRFIYAFKQVRKRKYQKSLKSLSYNLWFYWKKSKQKPQTKKHPKSFNYFKKHKIAKTSVTDAPQRNLSCKHLCAQLILSTWVACTPHCTLSLMTRIIGSRTWLLNFQMTLWEEK